MKWNAFPIFDHHSRMKWFFLYFFGQFLGLDGPYLALLGPLLASPASGLTPSTRRNPVSTRSRPIFDQKNFRDLGKIVFERFTSKIDSYGLGTIIERSASKFCISGLRRRVKRSSWSNFMAMSIRFILQWRSRLKKWREDQNKNSLEIQNGSKFGSSGMRKAHD